MDTYQSNMLQGLYKNLRAIYAYADSHAVDFAKCLSDQNLNTISLEDTITIKQDADITITTYHLIFVHEGIEAIYAIKRDEEILFQEVVAEASKTSPQKERRILYHELDFNDKIDSIRIEFKNHMADDLLLPIVFVDADEEAYYAKKEAERIAELHRRAAVSYATGAALVNIYFQPCSDSYAKTEIVLYHDEFMIAKYVIEGDQYFKPIADLAPNAYSFVLKQYSVDGELLLQTEQTTFRISSITSYDSGRAKNHSCRGFGY